MMTMQEIFNRAYLGVVNQGQLGSSSGGCAYRTTTDEGKVVKCGVGQLIPDEAYDPDFDGDDNSAPVDKLFKEAKFKAAMNAAGIDLKDRAVRDLLCSIQHAHDRSDTRFNSDKVGAFKEHMRDVAQNYGLEVPQC